MLARTQGNTELAGAHYQTTIEISQQIGRHDLVGRAHKRLGLIAHDLGNLSAAHDHLEMAFTILRAAGEHHWAKGVCIWLHKAGHSK